jgi:Putative peptidoglycan binding domain
MARILFQRASSGFRTVRGSLIEKIQNALQQEDLNPGTIDGVFGNNTERALLAYQQKNSLPQTGKVDEELWQKLTEKPIPSIRERCLQLTADFEGTGYTKIVGNFDGAGLTWGIIGFTLVHGELERIIKEINQNYPALLDSAFGSNKSQLLDIFEKPMSEQIAFADSISLGTGRMKVAEPWSSAFEKLGNFPEVQDIQMEGTQKYWTIADRDFNKFNLKTELGLALCFDTAVQNGGIDAKETGRIQRAIAQDSPTNEQQKRVIIANVVAENSNPRFIEDVRSRKLAIATASGTVHGSKYAVKTWGIDEINL